MRTNPSIESLDRRILLATLTVNGSSVNDEITLSVTPTSIVSIVNGVTTTTPNVGFEGVIVQARNGHDVIFVNTNTLRVTVLGGDGDDHLKCAFVSGNLDSIGAGIVFEGGNGTDTVSTFDDYSTGAGRTYVLSRLNSLDWGSGAQILNSGVENVSIIASQSDDTMYVDSGPSSAEFFLNGSDGKDRLILSLEASPLGIPNPVKAFLIEEIYFDDSLNTFSDTYTLSSSSLTRTVWAGLQFLTGPTGLNIKTGNGSDTFNLDSLPATLTFPPHIETGPNADRVFVRQVNSTVSVDAGTGDDYIYVNPLNAAGNLTVLLEPGDFNQIVIGNNATVRLVGAGLEWSRAYSLSLEPTSKLNLTQTSLILDVPSLGDPLFAKVDGWLASGYAGGNWNGYGIGAYPVTNSGRPAGVGSGPATLFSPSLPVTLGGFSADLSSIILRQTLQGDTNLDRVVNFDDLLMLSQQYGTNTLPFWFRGDFNYDGDTDFDDLLAQAQNYMMPYSQSAALVTQATPASLQALMTSKRSTVRMGRTAEGIFSTGRELGVSQ